MGESSRQTVYWFLEKEHGVSRHEIPKKPQEFIMGLNSLFAQGSSVLEKLILRELVLEFKIPSKPSSFAELVKDSGRSLR